MPPQISLGTRCIGPDHPVYVIAELSANHNQHFEQAVRIIEAAKQAGADAVKLQTYTADTITLKSSKEYFRVGGGTIWDRRNLHELYSEAYTPWDWQPRLKQVANDLGLDLFSTPFDPTAVDFLEKIERSGPQSCIVRTGGHSADSENGPDRQAAHHVHGNGNGGRNRRSAAGRAGGGCYPDRLAEVHEFLPGTGGGDESAHHPGAFETILSPRRDFGSHDGNCGSGGGGCAGSMHHREASHSFSLRTWAGQRVFPGTK